MADERFGMLCPICKDAFYLGKHLSNGIYNNDQSDFDRLGLLYDWMWKHLIECRKQIIYDNKAIVLFEVVAEGHPDLDISNNHWNRHKQEGFK